MIYSCRCLIRISVCFQFSRTVLRLDADSTACFSTLSAYPDTRESIRAAMAADTSLSDTEKETVEHLYLSGFYF